MMAVASASASTTRRLNRAVWGGRPLARQCRASRSTASSTISRSVGTRRLISTARSPRSAPDRAPSPCGGVTGALRTHRRSGASPKSEAGEGLLGGVGNREEGVEFGELEEGPEILVEPGEPEIAAGVAELLGQRHEGPQARRIDVAGVGEVDQHLPITGLDGVQHLLLELVTVAHDELPVHADHYHAPCVLSDRETHHPSVVCSSAAAAPRDRSAMGRASPCRIGPIATAPDKRCTSL